MTNDAFVKNVASQLIEQIRRGTAPWQKPWEPGTSFRLGEDCLLPGGRQATKGQEVYVPKDAVGRVVQQSVEMER